MVGKMLENLPFKSAIYVEIAWGSKEIFSIVCVPFIVKSAYFRVSSEEGRPAISDMVSLYRQES